MYQYIKINTNYDWDAGSNNLLQCGDLPPLLTPSIELRAINLYIQCQTRNMNVENTNDTDPIFQANKQEADDALLFFQYHGKSRRPTKLTTQRYGKYTDPIICHNPTRGYSPLAIGDN